MNRGRAGSVAAAEGRLRGGREPARHRDPRHGCGDLGCGTYGAPRARGHYRQPHRDRPGPAPTHDRGHPRTGRVDEFAMRITAGPIELHAHFFDTSEVELDLDPRASGPLRTHRSSWTRSSGWPGRRGGRRSTPESWHEAGWLSFGPIANRWCGCRDQGVPAGSRERDANPAIDRRSLDAMVRSAERLQVRRAVRAAVDLGHDVIDVGGTEPARERRERHDPLAQRMAQELACSPQTPRRAVPSLGRGPSPARHATPGQRGRGCAASHQPLTAISPDRPDPYARLDP